MWSKSPTPREVQSSESGFLELVGRAPDLSLREILIGFRELISADMHWVASRKVRFRTKASGVRILALAFAALSTVVLGIPEIPARASIALPIVALVTLLGGLETFFNWRSRWVLMEEAQYRFNRLRDDIDYYLVSTPTADLQRVRLDRFFEDQQLIWADVSRRWIEFRKLDRPPQIGQETTAQDRR
jgi:hypothetical protein